MDEELDFEVLLPEKVPPKKDVDFEVSISMGERPHNVPPQNVIYQGQTPYNAPHQNAVYPGTQAPYNAPPQNAQPQNAIYQEASAQQNVPQYNAPPQNEVYQESPIPQNTQPQDIHSEKFALTKLEQTYVSAAAQNQSIQPKETYVNIAVTRDTSQKEINVGSARSQFRPDEYSLIDWFLLFWRGKFIILASVILAVIAGVYVAQTRPEVFSSTAFFTLKNTKSGSSGLSQTMMMSYGIGKGGTDIDPSDYLDKVILDKNFISTLYDRKWLFNGDMTALEDIFGITPDPAAHNTEHTYLTRKYDRFRNSGMISIHKNPKTGILSLTTNAHYPQLAYDLNVHTLEYIDNYVRSSILSQAKEKRTFIADRAREAKNELAGAEVALARYRERNMMSTSPLIALEMGRLSRQVSLSQDIYTQLLKQLDIARMEELDDMPLAQIIKAPEIPYVRSKPNKKIILIAAFAMGMLLGCAAVFLKAAVTDQRLNKPQTK